jgi:DNA sulfur modification protein DndE
MTPPENIRLSEKARSQLINLKRRTGIQNWNVLCRWAFCLSIGQPSRPPDENIPSDSSIEMTWRTFSGGLDDIYWGMILVRATKDGVEMEKAALTHYFRLHLHRGISYLMGPNGADNLTELIQLAVKKAPKAKKLAELSSPV